MEILDLKYRYQLSLNIFGVSAVLSVALLLYSILVGNTWMLCFVPTIILFCIIGLTMTSKGLLVLSEKGGRTTEMTEDEYLERLYGVQGFRLMFLILAILIAVCVFIIMVLYSPSLLGLDKLNFISAVFFVVIAFLTYKVSKELSFAIMSTTILRTTNTD